MKLLLHCSKLSLVELNSDLEEHVVKPLSPEIPLNRSHLPSDILFPLPLPWSTCACRTRDAPSVLWRVSEYNTDSCKFFSTFSFSCCPLRRCLKTYPFTDLSPWAHSRKERWLWLSPQYGFLQNIYIGLFENTKRAPSSCLYETSLLQRFGQWSLCPHSKCRALLCNTRSNNWIKSIRKGRAKEWSPHPSWIGLLSVP